MNLIQQLKREDHMRYLFIVLLFIGCNSAGVEQPQYMLSHIVEGSGDITITVIKNGETLESDVDISAPYEGLEFEASAGDVFRVEGTDTGNTNIEFYHAINNVNVNVLTWVNGSDSPMSASLETEITQDILDSIKAP